MATANLGRGVLDSNSTLGDTSKNCVFYLAYSARGQQTASCGADAWQGPGRGRGNEVSRQDPKAQRKEEKAGAEAQRGAGVWLLAPLSGRCATVCGFAASLVRGRAWIGRGALQAQHWSRSCKAHQRRPMTDQECISFNIGPRGGPVRSRTTRVSCLRSPAGAAAMQGRPGRPTGSNAEKLK